MRRAGRRLLLAAVLAGLLVAVLAGAASAHPLGNFSVNTYAGLRVGPDRVSVDQVVDLAEIPTFQVRQQIAAGDGAVSAAELAAWSSAECGRLARSADGRVDGRRLAFAPASSRAAFSPGAGGLDVLRLECSLQAPAGALGHARHALTWTQPAWADRVGWHEITAVGDRTTLAASDVPATSRSQRLRAYPQDLLSSPPVQRDAALTFTLGGPRLADDGGTAVLPGLPVRLDRATRALTGLLANGRPSAQGAALALLLAVALGAMHALAPGHGKTVMAAYLVGLRGSPRQALVIGATVTLTHTAGVLALGLALSATRALAPERLYPWLGLASGLLLAGLGVALLRRGLAARTGGHRHPHHEHLGHPAGTSAAHAPHEHPGDPAGASAAHAHPHPHQDPHHDDTGHPAGASAHPRPDPHHDHPGHPAGASAHPRPDPHHDHPGHPADTSAAGQRGGHDRAHPARAVGRGNLVVLGFAGGLVPSPSALVVLLGAAAIGRPWLGLALVLAYGVGMAATLTGAGLLLVRARGLIERGPARLRSARLARAAGLLPVGTASLIVLGGLGLALRGVAQL